MQTRRDRVLIVLLMLNAALNAANTTTYLTELAPVWVVASVGLLAAMLSASTGVYVAITREPVSAGQHPLT